VTVFSSQRTEPTEGTVLVVEDEPALRSLLKDGLVDEGYGVDTAVNACEALHALEEKKTDVVLLDIMLPGMNGLELAKEIRQRWPIYIIAMSASSSMLDRAENDPSVDGTVSKPFDWDSLLLELQKV
jgi:CheY-like chemotaxis protein